jgi:3-oxoacyl-[acyl-carrier protein] reductase
MDQKSVLVTGSSRGIGKAIAEKLSRDNYSVVLHSRRLDDVMQNTLQTLVASGAKVRSIHFDVADRAQARSALEADVAEHGAYYGVVCNAGIARDSAFPAMPAEDWDAVVHTNLDAFYNVLHPLIMPMVRRRAPGRIVTLSSVSGVMGNRGQVNYSAAKAGIIGATKALAIELAKREITVNCVAPGMVRTDMVDAALLEQAMEMIPMRRAGEPDEVAALVAFLISDAAGYITRQVISINGGMY